MKPHSVFASFLPVGQLFFPPYLFKQDGSRAARPVIANAPEDISYGGHFDITVASNPDQISSVVMLRSDHNTHSLTTADRYVKLSFHQKGAAHKRQIRIKAPRLPAQAVPGIYMLFVLDQAGVPSLAKRIYLRLAAVHELGHVGCEAHNVFQNRKRGNA